MKYFFSITCALFLIGCGNSATSTASTQEASAQAQTSTPSAADTNSASAAPAQTPSATPAQSESAPASAPTATVDASALFGQKCVSCHGAKAEKQALGKSQVIATFNTQQIKDALKGYQAGTYGKEMKAVMQGQAKSLNDAQIDALAAYIPTLK